MPERKGVLSIADEHLRRGDAKAKRSLAEISSAASQTFREQRNRAPFRRSAPGPMPSPSRALPGAHKVTLANHFNSLTALLRNILAPLLVARPRSETPRRGSKSLSELTEGNAPATLRHRRC